MSEPSGFHDCIATEHALTLARAELVKAEFDTLAMQKDLHVRMQQSDELRADLARVRQECAAMKAVIDALRALDKWDAPPRWRDQWPDGAALTAALKALDTAHGVA